MFNCQQNSCSGKTLPFANQGMERTLKQRSSPSPVDTVSDPIYPFQVSSPNHIGRSFVPRRYHV